MEVVNLLKSGHRDILAIFEELAGTTSRGQKRRRKLLGQLRREIAIHHELEVQHLYPRMGRLSEIRERIAAAHDEQLELMGRLEALVGLDPTTMEWEARIDGLKEIVDRHIFEEEKDLFPSVRRLLGAMERQQIGLRMQAQRQVLLLAPLVEAEPAEIEDQADAA